MPDTTITTSPSVTPAITPARQGPAFGALTITFDRAYMGFPVSLTAEQTDAHGHATPLRYRTLVAPHDTRGTTRYVAHFPRVIVPQGGADDGTYQVSFNARIATGRGGASTAPHMVVAVAPNTATEVRATQFRPTWL